MHKFATLCSNYNDMLRSLRAFEKEIGELLEKAHCGRILVCTKLRVETFSLGMLDNNFFGEQKHGSETAQWWALTRELKRFLD